MSLELKELKEKHDKAYISGIDTRRKGSEDLVFYWITQWDDDSLNETQLAYRGEFNILRKAGRQILADLYINPVQIDFYPTDEEDEEDTTELLDGLYRADDNNNRSQEAYDYGKQDSVVCGFGA